MKNVANLKVLCHAMKNIALFKDCNVYHCKFITIHWYWAIGNNTEFCPKDHLHWPP